MKALLIEHTDSIGAAIQQLPQEKGHQLIGASHGAGEHRVDLAAPASIAGLLAAFGRGDAIVSPPVRWAEASRLADARMTTRNRGVRGPSRAARNFKPEYRQPLS